MSDETDRAGDPPTPGRNAVMAFLTTDELDAGCAATWELIHVYVELQLAGEDPAQSMPALAAHLRSCPPCSEDHAGLRNALMTAEAVVAEVRAGTVGPAEAPSGGIRAWFSRRRPRPDAPPSTR